MTQDEINREIEMYLDDQWAMSHPIVWGNIKSMVDEQDKPFLKAAVRYSSEDKENVGKVSCNRIHGILFVNVFVLIDTGERLLQEMTEAIKVIFRNLNLSGIIFRKRNITYVGENDRFIQQNISIQFQHDDIS